MLNATFTCRMYGNTVASGNTYGNHPGDLGAVCRGGTKVKIAKVNKRRVKTTGRLINKIRYFGIVVL